MDKLLYTFFDGKNKISIKNGRGIYLYDSKGNKYTDLTSGQTGHALLGWGNTEIINKIVTQLKRIAHIDYKYFKDDNRALLANLLLSNKKNKLDRVFFVGASGAEACEAAVHMSYQVHFNNNKKNKIFCISRKQSYHGCTNLSIALGDRPNLDFYKKILNKNNRKINEHNYYRYKKKNETPEDYSLRSSFELEKEILKLGPENISCFVAETMSGGLIGDVPPTLNYWKNIRKICNKYNIHLILDEVWCGTGVSGKMFCIDYDDITPDFIFLGKTLAVGYGSLSAVVTSKKLLNSIKYKQGQIQYSNTHQGHSLSVAAALAAQNIINKKEFLYDVNEKGKYLRNVIDRELKNHEFYFNVRGRGLRNSIEYKCHNQNQFGLNLKKIMLDKHKIIIDAKWHRICLSLALNIKKDQLSTNIEILISEFKKLSSKWSKRFAKSIYYKSF